MYRFSNRLHWAATENPFSRVVSELRADGQPLTDLTVSNPTEALDCYPHTELAAALSAIPSFTYQPDPFGDRRARLEIIRRGQKTDLDISQIALTSSTSEAYSILFKLLANPGDEVLVPVPSYPLFGFLADLEGIKLSTYQLIYDGSWYIDFASLAAAISPRTRAVVLVNPNNPTGSYLKASELTRLCSICRQHSLPLISDEVFTDYPFSDSADRVATLTGSDEVLSFSLNGLSKRAGMPQMKLGWICINGPAPSRLEACQRLELILDTYLSVGAPVQFALERLLNIGDDIRERIRTRTRKNLAALISISSDSPIHALHVEGGWSAVLHVPNILAEDQWITRLAREAGVVVQPGYFFDMPGEAFLVVSLLTAEAAFAEGVTKLRDFAIQL